MSAPERHVLVVDDNEDNRLLLAQLLRDEFVVTLAQDGREAIAALEERRPDLLLLDLMMPVLDGFGVLAHLEANPGAFLPVIVLTASTERDERLRALRAGAHEFLTKPLDDEELFARITTLMSLKAARDEAEQAARFKSMFLATMSHEIRTPLTAIIGFAETLQEPGRNAQEIAEAQRTILRSGKHLLHIINDILDLSKLETGSVQVERLTSQLFGILSDLESILGSQAREKGVAFVLEPVFPLPATVRSDPTRIRQVLLNLCGNALKFTEKGEVRLRVSCDPGREMLRFEVSDTGIGMTAEQLANLFQPYRQAEVSTARRYGGTGLGLYISSRLAEALGGSIEAESTVGQGSRFTLTIATGTLAGVTWLMQAEDAPAQRLVEDVPDLTGARVLLAEDTPANQRLIGHYVRRTGATVAIVEDGGQAVEEALGGDYDLVLMDMQMPVMDGMEATSLLRKTGFGRPILALTANVMAEDVAAYVRAGCTACLAKPVDRERFYQALKEHLGGLSPRRAEPLDPDPLVRELAEQFRQELPAALRELEAAAAGATWTTVRSLAHRLRGTAGSLGFPEICTVAGQLEDALRADRLADAQAALATLVRLQE